MFDSFFYPHTVVVRVVTQAVVDPVTRIAGNQTIGDPVTVMADVQPMKPSEAFRNFGVELTNPIKLFVALADADKFPPQAQITWNGDNFAVIAQPETHPPSGLGLEHAVIYATGLTYEKTQ